MVNQIHQWKPLDVRVNLDDCCEYFYHSSCYVCLNCWLVMAKSRRFFSFSGL
jgi:hypothetical protein